MEQFDVFISYSRKDIEIAERIEQELKKYDISYFIDRTDINLGEDFAEKIAECIYNCNILLFVWSENSNLSENTANEIALAFEFQKTIVPFKIGKFKTDFKLAYRLSRLNRIEVPDYNDNNIHEMAAKLAAQLGKPNVPDAPKHNEPSPCVSADDNEIPASDTVLKVLTDTECRVFIDYEDKGIAHPDEIKRIPLCPGSYHLRFENISDKSCFVENPKFTLNEHKEELYNVRLKKRFNIFLNTFSSTITETNKESGATLSTPQESIKETNKKKNSKISINRRRSLIAQFGEKITSFKPKIDLLAKHTDSTMSPEEMYNEGEKFYYGEDVTLNYKQAVYWYQKAAEKGNSYAMNKLGICYYNGEGVAQDFNQSVYWYQKAAEAGNAYAMNNLGECYYNGNGVTRNMLIASRLYEANELAKDGDRDRAVEIVKKTLIK